MSAASRAGAAVLAAAIGAGGATVVQAKLKPSVATAVKAIDDAADEIDKLDQLGAYYTRVASQARGELAARRPARAARIVRDAAKHAAKVGTQIAAAGAKLDELDDGVADPDAGTEVLAAEPPFTSADMPTP